MPVIRTENYYSACEKGKLNDPRLSLKNLDAKQISVTAPRSVVASSSFCFFQPALLSKVDAGFLPKAFRNVRNKWFGDRQAYPS